jgi:hypothetical protein
MAYARTRENYSNLGELGLAAENEKKALVSEPRNSISRLSATRMSSGDLKGARWGVLQKWGQSAEKFVWTWLGS